MQSGRIELGLYAKYKGNLKKFARTMPSSEKTRSKNDLKKGFFWGGSEISKKIKFLYVIQNRPKVFSHIN